ncbi:hypothetical protein [Streptomyces sp. NPDC001889]
MDADGTFEAATGDGPAGAAGGEERAAEVRAAWAGLLQIRALTGTGGMPAAWERGRMVWAVGLALEAGGVAPAAGGVGYRVRGEGEGGLVVVEWVGVEEEVGLRECVRVLREAGWEALLYRGPRRKRFLEVEPPTPPPPGA